MKENETALFSGPVLADAAARASRKKEKKSTNECLPRVRKRRGGQPGNANALRHGRRSAAYLAARRALRARLKSLRIMLHATRALRMDPELESVLVERIGLLSNGHSRGPP